jgi:hypothetical protein
MRWSFLLLLVFAAACDWPAVTDSSTGGGSTADAGNCAAGNAACTDCQSCAVKGPCEALYSACESDPDCSAIDGCAGGCAGDATCIQTCYANNPNGQAAYQAAGNCIYCEQCTCTGLCSSL